MNKHNRAGWVLVLVSLTFVLLPASLAAQARQPNILVIWGDDIGRDISVPTASA